MARRVGKGALHPQGQGWAAAMVGVFRLTLAEGSLQPSAREAPCKQALGPSLGERHVSLDQISLAQESCAVMSELHRKGKAQSNFQVRKETEKRKAEYL